jgi:hypothetical protein
MRVGTNIDPIAGNKLGWTGLIEKNERTDHLTLRRR